MVSHQYAVKVRRHTPWSRVRCQFHSRRHSLLITLKYTTLVRMRSSYAWTMKPWQQSEWRLGFNSVYAVEVIMSLPVVHSLKCTAYSVLTVLHSKHMATEARIYCEQVWYRFSANAVLFYWFLLCFYASLKVLGRVLACAKLHRERINCTSVYLFLHVYGESTVKISTQTDSY